MSTAHQVSEGGREMGELAQHRVIDGVFVRARCFAIRRERGPRYEVLLDGAGQYAATDARSIEEARRLIPHAMEAFAAACALRGATRVPEPPRP